MMRSVPMSTYPIKAVRSSFPALNRVYRDKQVVYFDGPGGSQVVQSVIQAMVNYMSNGGANLHGQFPSSEETEEAIRLAREAMSDLVGAKPEEIAFGQNSTSLGLSIARALSRDWKPGDNIVVTEMDHRANVDPWLTAAEDHGVEVRWIPVSLDRLTLDLSDLDQLIDDHTQLVAVTAASNAIGTITNLKPILDKANDVGAISIIDAVHAVPHFHVNRDELGASILLCSAYKFFGPHIGIAAIRSEVFDILRPYKIKPAPNDMPDKLETGTQNHEAIAALPAAIEFIEKLGQGQTRRERLIDGYHQIEAHENRLAKRIRENLRDMPSVRLFQADDTVDKTPTIAFNIKGLKPHEVCRRLSDDYGIFVADGDFYAMTLADKLGIQGTGGWVRLGLAPYNSDEEVDRFLDAIRSLVQK